MRAYILLSVVLLQISCNTVLPSKKQPSTEVRVNILFIIADDMSRQAGIYGDRVISTPGIDNLAKDGVVFEKAFCASPSCSPSRASILTGRYPHQMKEGGNLWGTLPVAYSNYVSILEKNGYKSGVFEKGWGPGNFTVGGYKENPAGPRYESFENFITKLPAKTPFCFWLGAFDPHRPYDPAFKKSTNINAEELKVPSWLPDNAQVREDLMDYYAEVKRFDETIEKAVKFLKEKGMYDNTLIIVTSDNGMPFPRAKANLYDSGTNVPLIMRWGNHFKKGRRYSELVNLIDMAPTLLEAANVEIPSSITGKSLLPLLLNGKAAKRFDNVFLERERHANIRHDNLGYPMRGIRTHNYLYINNLRSDRWPAGDPDFFSNVGPFGDIDNGPSKKFLIDNRYNPEFKKQVEWSLEKRPSEELYDLRQDPDQLNNLAGIASYNVIKKQLAEKIMNWRVQTQDPLLNSRMDIFDTYPYYGVGLKK
ncbi:MAG TPA: sulfatase [Sphingobacteriaceae bacterium]|nr:sulfatase [Sphingobacteriaceae bacterium]